MTRFRCQEAMDELQLPLSGLDEDVVEEIMQHNMCNIEGSTDNAEQIVGHDDNDVPRHDEDVARRTRGRGRHGCSQWGSWS
jgi:hypothetical protein